MPNNETAPPVKAKNIFSGRLLVMPNCRSINCIMTVNTMEDEVIIDVSDAPILLKLIL
jgi:hypothetical protein